MTSGTIVADVMERRDVALDEAFEVITDGAIRRPNALQQALFPRLMTQDTGLLIPTGPGAGKLEAIFVPSVIGMRTSEVAHRLFIIGPDGAPLDDYAYRLGPYLRSLVIADESPRTIWFEEPDRAPIARKYLPDGTMQNGASDHPLSEDVDVIVMPFSHFRSLFFSSGGVHGVPEGIGFDLEAAEGMAPRGLFYFDDSYGPSRSQQGEFIQLVEFLYAQDLDVVVGTSCMPVSLREEMSFLETLAIDAIQCAPNCLLQFTPVSHEDMINKIVEAALGSAAKGARVGIALNSPSDDRINEIYQRVASAAPRDACLYRTSDSRAVRGRAYADLMARGKEGIGYLVITDAPALQTSDLDLNLLISEPCDSLSLVRRAGRVNRRQENIDSLLHIVGDLTSSSLSTGDDASPTFTEALRQMLEPAPFDSDMWYKFCD